MSYPSKPMNIRERIEHPSAQSTPLSTPDIRALRSQYIGTPPPNVPPRQSPIPFAGSSTVSLVPPSVVSASTSVPRSVGEISAARTDDRSGTSTPLGNLDGLSAEEKMKVLRRHLVSKDERNRDETTTPPRPSISVSSTPSEADIDTHALEGSELFPVPYHAPGADVTHDIYKYQSKQRRLSTRARANSYSHRPPTPEPAFEHIHEPGGFRRNYVLLRANEQGIQEPQILNNFIDFLYLFGHFAGEDLEEDEEDKDEDEEQTIAGPSSTLVAGLSDTETTSLLGPKHSRSRSRRRANSAGPHMHGNASVTQAVLMLLKAFVGTGVLFLGRAFFNGGILFSSLLFVFIAAISLYSFLLLVDTKFVVSGSFGDIGGILFGPWMRNLILTSIVVSQIGFCSAYIIFVGENLQAFVLGVTQCARLIGVGWFILLEAILFLPLVLIRDLAKLSTSALVADAFILVGLVYIFGSEFKIIARQGVQHVEMFNPKDFTLFVGTAVFSFEGIGLVIPITDAMKEPHRFPAVLSGVMFFLTFLFGGAGVLAYLTFGSDVQTVVLVNLDTRSKMVQTVQFFYSIAILLSVPLQLFPAVRIMENKLFSTRTGKGDLRVKWMKNLFRWATVAVAAVISYIGAADLDKFVAFVGCFACVPLCYVYPAMLHYKACAQTTSAKVKDILMIVFGMIVAVYTSVQTIKLMLEPATGGGPIFGNCDTPGLDL